MLVFGNSVYELINERLILGGEKLNTRLLNIMKLAHKIINQFLRITLRLYVIGIGVARYAGADRYSCRNMLKMKSSSVFFINFGNLKCFKVIDGEVFIISIIIGYFDPYFI